MLSSDSFVSVKPELQIVISYSLATLRKKKGGKLNRHVLYKTYRIVFSTIFF